MKYRLYDRMDETKVCNYLAGSHELDGTPLKRKWQPNYSELLNTLNSSDYISQDELQALKAIQEDGNQGMHDSDEKQIESKLKRVLSWCMPIPES